MATARTLEQLVQMSSVVAAGAIALWLCGMSVLIAVPL